MSNFGIDGAVHTASGNVICTLLPPVTICPGPLSAMGGSVVPQVCALPPSMRLVPVPDTVRFASSQMLTVPVPWLVETDPGQVTDIVTCAASIKFAVCGQAPASASPPELLELPAVPELLDPLDPPLPELLELLEAPAPELVDPLEPPLLELLELLPPEVPPPLAVPPPSPPFTWELLDPPQPETTAASAAAAATASRAGSKPLASNPGP
jgi:hypothetical protein